MFFRLTSSILGTSNFEAIYLFGEAHEELDELEGEDSLFIEENGEPKFAIIPIELFDALESYRGIIEGNRR